MDQIGMKRNGVGGFRRLQDGAPGLSELNGRPRPPWRRQEGDIRGSQVLWGQAQNLAGRGLTMRNSRPDPVLAGPHREQQSTALAGSDLVCGIRTPTRS